MAALNVQDCYLADLLSGSPSSGQGYYAHGAGQLRYYMSGRDECWIDVGSRKAQWAAGEPPRKTLLWFYELGTGQAAFCVRVDEDGTIHF